MNETAVKQFSFTKKIYIYFHLSVWKIEKCIFHVLQLCSWCYACPTCSFINAAYKFAKLCFDICLVSLVSDEKWIIPKMMHILAKLAGIKHLRCSHSSVKMYVFVQDCVKGFWVLAFWSGSRAPQVSLSAKPGPVYRVCRIKYGQKSFCFVWSQQHCGSSRHSWL